VEVLDVVLLGVALWMAAEVVADACLTVCDWVTHG